MSLLIAKHKSRDEPIIAVRKGTNENREHLTRPEYEKYRSETNWPLIEPILSNHVYDLVQPNNFTKLMPVQKDYVLLLAFLQRISLPFELAFPTKIVFNNFPFAELSNFQYFDDLYERHYPLLYPMDSEKQSKKAKYKIPLLRTVVSLWLAGYALKVGLDGNRVITALTLEKASQFAKYHRSSLTILSKILAKEADSEIESKPIVSFDEAEKNLWISAGIYPSKTPFEESLSTFSFFFLVQRVYGVTTEDLFDDQGVLLFRYGKKTISQNYWKLIVKYIRYFAVSCRSKGISEISEISIADVYTEVIGKMKGQENRKFFRVALRMWLKWLNLTTTNQFNVERIIPSPKRVLSKSHGRVYSLSKAYILIQTLLNDQSPLINENDLMDFRHRRGCLLLLSTAARPQEILNLLQQAITKDAQGDYWVRFHKTKTIRNMPNRKTYEWVHQAPVKLDAVRWFNELMHFAPTDPLHFPIEWGGDDLTELRLLASKHNDMPIRTHGLYLFLGRIQRKLWPELTKPYFTPHDLRALHLTYRRILGDNDSLLERQAGHNHPSSKIPYTQTMSAEEVAKFGEIFKKGVWASRKIKEAKSGDETSDSAINDVNIDDITNVSSKFMVTPDKLEEVFILTQQVMEAASLKFQGKIIEAEEELSEAYVGGYTHNCNAHVLLNCGHTPGHCRACDYYSPDEGTEGTHQAEVFREMVHYYKCKEADQEFKSLGYRKMVFQKAEDIKERLDTTETMLWVNKFGMKLSDAKKLHSMLWKKAKSYFRFEFRSKPNPSSEEILRYISSGGVT